MEIGSQHRIFEGIEMGVGTWSWGDRLVWEFGNGYGEDDVREAFQESLAGGIHFFDSAERYGDGKSETILGDLAASTDQTLVIATKIVPYPWRLGKNALRNALLGSLQRLKMEKIALYQMHVHLPPVAIENWMDQMADVCEEGLIEAIGVSNYNLEQTKSAHEVLLKRGLRLASTQMEYNLLDRKIESNGIMDYCKTEGIKVIAYSPMAMGSLTGKYTPEHIPSGTRAVTYNRDYLARIQPFLKTLSRIGNDEGKTSGQVAINWVIQKGALPIPGAKNAQQAIQNLGAMGWKLKPEDLALLDELSLKYQKA